MPELAIREAYCPAHFGNSYEAMWPLEMERYLAEMRHWGFNRFGDWLTSFDLGDPYSADTYSTLAIEVYERKKAAFRAAARMGMQLDLVLCANHVYLDQLHPDLLAQRTPKILGQLLCPSRAEARAIILDNFDRQFRDLSEHGIRLSSFTAFAYDFGGCSCDRCAPWILTFAGLVVDIRATARRYFPDVEVWVASWWWTDDEYRQFGEWASRSGPDAFRAVVFHIPYGKRRMDLGSMPAGCRSLAFLHLGYGDVAGNGDLYAKFGAVVAAQRLPESLSTVAAQGAVGFQAYSEGAFDDVNKAIAGALAAGRAASAEEVLREYAARYFGARGAAAERWVRWLVAWGDRGAVDLPSARAEFQRLAASATPGWRLEHLRSKLVLEELDRELAAGDDVWDHRRLALADCFQEEQERLNRAVYGLGPVRAIFTPKISPPRWYASWRAVIGDSSFRPFSVSDVATEARQQA